MSLPDASVVARISAFDDAATGKSVKAYLAIQF